MIKIKTTIFALGLFLLTASNVAAAGIGVSPKLIEVSQFEVDTTKTSVAIHNTGESEAKFLVEADDFPQLITADPSEFILGPGEGKAVDVTLNKLPVGKYNTFLSIIAEDVTTEQAGPKTGLKLPVNLEIYSVQQDYQQRFTPIIVGFILVAFVLMLLAYWKEKHMSRTAKLTDAIQEKVAKRSFPKLVKHYLKHHGLIVLSTLALLITGLLLVWSLVTPPPSIEGSNPLVLTQGQTLEVTIETSDKNQVYQINPDQHFRYSAFTALEKLAEVHDVELKYDPPNEFGVFVTNIDGYENGTDGKYWVYEVNNQRIPVAADKYVLQEEDKLIWKFVNPE